MAETTRILFHGCAHAYQDSQYGNQMRLFNRTKEGDSKVFRCTVCGGTQSHGMSDEENKKLNRGKR
jgi:hypothetical protein